jgi:citrate lyase subunit beta / citryl-CoA lyase
VTGEGARRGARDAVSQWRSVLFVPGNRPELAAKALRMSPDVVVVDLEDAVPPDEKVASRSTARDAVARLVGRVSVCVRVNAAASEWFQGDVASLSAGLVAVVVPKWDAPIDVGFPVVAGLETVRGVVDCRTTLIESVAACYFGAEDYVADLGGVRTSSNAEVHYARSLVGMAARLAGVSALDMVTTDFRDGERFTREAREARALGYAGKLCIHPDQVPLANEAFTPSREEVAHAERLLSAFDAAGRTAIGFEGQMVDEVVAAQARAVIARARP